MTINELYKKVATGPTMLTAEAMIALLLEIESININELKSKKTIFYETLDLLIASHADTTYFAVTEENKYYFIDFSNWLKKISHEFISVDDRNNLHAISEVFLMFPWEIYSSSSISSNAP